MRAMILAAGLGTRLRPLTYVMPKPVAPVLNRPIVAWVAERVASHGFKAGGTNVSHLAEAGGFGKVRDFLSEPDSFLVISGDALTDIDLSAMRAAHEANVERDAIV